MRRYMKYGGHEEQQARQDMENCPIMPYLVIAFIVGHMQFDSEYADRTNTGIRLQSIIKIFFICLSVLIDAAKFASSTGTGR